MSGCTTSSGSVCSAPFSPSIPFGTEDDIRVGTDQFPAVGSSTMLELETTTRLDIWYAKVCKKKLQPQISDEFSELSQF